MTDPTAPTGDARLVVVDTSGGESPSFAMYRDGVGGPWLAPRALPTGYELTVVDDAYLFVAVCANATGFDAEALAATRSGDGETAAVSCVHPSTTPAPTPALVTVSGDIVEPGTVSLGGAVDSSLAADWHYALQVTPGTHDLFAIDAGKLAIVRDVGIAGPTALPSIDIDRVGTQLATTTLALAPLDTDETLHSSTTLYTDHDALLVSQTDDATIAFPPTSMLASTDTQELEVSAEAIGTARDTRVVGASPPASLELLPRLTGVTFSGASAAWTELPAIDRLELTLDAPTQLSHVTATASYLAAAGTSTLAFDTSAPGYDPAWQIARARDTMLGATKRGTGVVETTTAFAHD